MKRFIQKHVRPHHCVGAAAVILLTIAAGSFAFGARMEWQSTIALRAGRIDRTIAAAADALQDAETGQRGYLLTREDAYLTPYNDAAKRFAENLQRLRTQVTELDSEGTHPDLDRLDGLARRKFAEMSRTIELARGGDLAGATNLIKTGLGQSLMIEIRAFMAEFNAATSEVRMRYVGNMRSSATRLAVFTSLSVGVVILLSIIALLLLAAHARALEAARQALADLNAELESKVAERTRNLAVANQEVQRYAYIISHDLRAPLINIIGFTNELETATAHFAGLLERCGLGADDPQVVLAATAIRDDIPEALHFIRSSMARMDSLISAILKLSRLGQVSLEPVRVDVVALLADCVATVQHQLDEQGAVAVVETPMPTLITDRFCLEQVFANLLDNAIKYAHHNRKCEIKIRGRRDNAMVVFEVEDNGRGIAPSDHERIFDLFRRAGPQDRPGDGIGLAHVRTLTRRLGGDISVASDGHSGTIFRVTVAANLNRQLRSDVN